ncbi:MAG: preprotein translocase subunit SecE [Deltaproteobacteria bacterium]|jgi:preprotein translocase subunit SecE|nr:preprotein translocase subunit SecE [Deltaproteobacteria bacterium]
MSVARYVNLSFVVIGLLLYVILGEVFASVFGIFGSSVNFAVLGSKFRLAHLLALVASAGVAIWLRRHDKIHSYAMEVGSELSKVTWPTWKDTKRATLVVIITTLVLSCILGLMDVIWGALSRWFYS